MCERANYFAFFSSLPSTRKVIRCAPKKKRRANDTPNLSWHIRNEKNKWPNGVIAMSCAFQINKLLHKSVIWSLSAESALFVRTEKRIVCRDMSFCLVLFRLLGFFYHPWDARNKLNTKSKCEPRSFFSPNSYAATIFFCWEFYNAGFELAIYFLSLFV